MKKALLVLMAGIIATTNSFAQNGFYLSPSVGIGMGNGDFSREDNSFNRVTHPATFVYHGKLIIGYEFNNWRLQTGIQYFNSKYKIKGALFSSDFDPTGNATSANSVIQNSYKHIGIPLQLGYVLGSDRKLSVVPYVGIIAAYNFRNFTDQVSVSGAAIQKRKWEADVFNPNFNGMSIWGTAAVHLEYKLSKRISIIAGPSSQYMISNFRNNPSGTVYQSTQHNYTLSLDAGVKIKL
ncbi:MAG: hypothetical protein EOP51_32360 [Sphingobacteriales bacterium]|nr:MAG: hypothetical protein EOP51_32360 [Sphingobacteriales bacterium]